MRLRQHLTPSLNCNERLTPIEMYPGINLHMWDICPPLRCGTLGLSSYSPDIPFRSDLTSNAPHWS